MLHINCNYILSPLHQAMMENLANKGINGSVFVPTYDRNRAVIIPNQNVVVSECFKKWDRLFFDYKQEKIYKDIQRRFDMDSFGIIHAYTVFSDGNCARRLAKKFRKNYIVAVRDTDINTFFRNMPFLRERGIQILKEASAIIFLSPMYREQLLLKYVRGQDRELIRKKAYIIPNGIDSFWLNNLYSNKDYAVTENRIERKELRFIQVGAVSRRKNIGTTIEALKKLRRRGWKVKLVVVGNIENSSEYRKIEQTDFVNYVGIKSKEALLPFLRKSDVFILPSHTETFGLVYAEAMTQGLPLIYTRGQGFDGQFPEGEVGFAISDKDPAEIANAIERISDRYQILSKNCLKGATKFNWSRITDEYKNIYEKL